MLTNPEMQDIVGALAELILTVDQNDRSTYLKGYVGTGDFWRELNLRLQPASNHFEWANLSVQICMDRGWRDSPPSWMERLLLGLDADPLAPRRLPGMLTIVARIAMGPTRDPRREAIESELGLDDVPFLDRDEVRKGVRELLEPDGRKVLVIEGDDKSGRSYCSELFQFISSQRGYSFKVASVEVEKGQGRAYTPELLAINIAGAMGATLSPPYVDPKHRTIDPYKNAVLELAFKNLHHHWWIMLDGFRDLPKENETRKLIQAMAKSITLEYYREKLRLILVDYNDLGLHPMRVIPHKVSAHSIGKKHIRSYFEKLKVKHNSGLTKEDLDAFTDGVWDSLPNDATRLDVMNHEVSLLALQVIRS